MVHDGLTPGWFCKTAAADGKQETSCALAAESCFSGGFASVDFMFKRAVGAASSRLSTVTPLALAERA